MGCERDKRICQPRNSMTPFEWPKRRNSLISWQLNDAPIVPCDFIIFPNENGVTEKVIYFSLSPNNYLFNEKMYARINRGTEHSVDVLDCCLVDCRLSIVLFGVDFSIDFSIVIHKCTRVLIRWSHLTLKVLLSAAERPDPYLSRPSQENSFRYLSIAVKSVRNGPIWFKSSVHISVCT